jgi:ATP-dependent DNA helicase RecG
MDEMRRMARFESFDEQPIPDLDSEALDFRAASELFAPVRRLPRTAFRTLKIMTEHHGRDVPSVGGYLLFGKNRFDRFPDAWIQAGRFDGHNRARLIDSIEIRSLLPHAAIQAVEFVQKHLTRAAVIEGMQRVERWTVPIVALREAMVNAVVHADYAQQGSRIRVAVFDDRLEIENPGLLPLGLTIEDIQHGVSKLRNRVIGRVFHELGMIEQWGSGIQRMTAACLGAGLPSPKLEETGNHFRVTLSTVQGSPAELDEKNQAIVELLADGRGHSTAQIAKAVSLSARAARTRLVDLVQRGLIAEIASSASDPRKRYFLLQDAE